MVKDLGVFIKENFGLSTIFLPEKRETGKGIFSPHESITKKNLLDSAKGLLSALPILSEDNHPKAKVRKIVSLEEMINSLTDRIKKAVKLSFSEFANSRGGEDAKGKKINTVISFLAVLELFKQGIVKLTQNEQFSEIEIEKNE